MLPKKMIDFLCACGRKLYEVLDKLSRGAPSGSVPARICGFYAFQAFVCARSQSAHGSMPSPLSAEIGNT